MPAKLLMATSQGDGERLKDMLNKEDAAVTVSGNLATTGKEPTLATINPVLLRLACSGDSAGLDFLVNYRAATQAQAQEILGNLALYTSSNGGSDDVEEGGALPAPSLLLEGVTGKGDTALHMVAACGHGGSFLRSADIIHGKAGDLLFAQNNEGDTPVHCAARAGNLEMVSWLIHLAKLGGDDMNHSAARVKLLLEKENKLKETALHEAVRIGKVEMVEQLMKEDPDLAGFPRTGGTSPLYLAILLEYKGIVAKLFKLSGGGTSLSYSGPNGQNALHAAAIRGPEFTKMLLEWKKALSAQKDETGSTPLHLAAALSRQGQPPNSSYSTQFHGDLHEWRKSHQTIATQTRRTLKSLFGPQGQPKDVCLQLLDANPAVLYEPDHHGSYPIHIATSVGATKTVVLFLKKYPNSAGLRDARGRTFLHIAVEKTAVGILYHATRDKSLAWILNMRDKDGNTAMHLAVQGGRLRTFCRLLGNRKILLNLPNAEGETCLDLSRYKVPPGLYYSQNSEACIRRALAMVGARSGTSREDHFEKKYENHPLKLEEENRESDNMKETTQTLSIGSVLIATVTFGATFALPGGYKADDHPNGGSPTLAGTYAFDAFMMANTLAFICASMATVGFMFSGTPMVNRRSRKFHLRSSVYFMEASVTSLTAAFALGVYMVLAPVAYKAAVAVCAVSPFALLWKNVDYWKRWLRFAVPFWVRKGLFWTLQEFVRQFVWNILLELWPLVIIFCWAAFANTSTHF